MNSDELRALPAVVDLRTAAAVLDIGRTAAYELVRTGQWPTPVLRLGGRIRVPTAPLLDLLGLLTDPPTRVPSGEEDIEGTRRPGFAEPKNDTGANLR